MGHKRLLDDEVFGMVAIFTIPLFILQQGSGFCIVGAVYVSVFTGHRSSRFTSVRVSLSSAVAANKSRTGSRSMSSDTIGAR